MNQKRRKSRAGRPKMSEDKKKKRDTVSLRPRSIPVWQAFATKCGVSKGALVEWLVLAPEAKGAREEALKHARYFIPRES